MKGFYIFEEEFVKGTVDCLEIGYIDHTFTHQIDSGTLSEEVKMHALVSKGRKAKCSPDDTYDFETGALIALMKMCGVDKVVRACNEAFSEDTFKTYATMYERELNSLKKDFDKVRDLEEFYKKNYNERLEEIKHIKEKNAEIIKENSNLKYIKSCNEFTIKGLENTRDLLTKENEKLKSDKDKSWKNYQRKIQKKQDRINELERAYKASNNDKAKLVEYYQREIKKLEAENEKLKLDCEKLQKGYSAGLGRLVNINGVNYRECDEKGRIDTDMIFCGGRQNGKQYTLLVDLFKKIDQKKVDAAYKEAYNKWVKQPAWQKEVFKQLRKDQLVSLLEAGKYAIPTEFTFRIDQVKPPTKREQKWERILKIHKKSNVVIVVEKEDVTMFLHEIEDKIPEIRWVSRQKIFEAKGTIKDIYGALKTCDRIYFRLWKENELSYSSDPDIYQYKYLEHISYLPPMRWDLFKKGRLAVKVNYNNYKDFYAACEKELGKKPMTVYTGDYTVSICKKDGLFEIFTMEHQKKTGRKIVDWEDVR